MPLEEYSRYKNNLRLFITEVFPKSMPIFGEKHKEIIDLYDKFNQDEEQVQFLLGILGSKGCCKTHLESLIVLHTILTRDKVSVFIISGKVAQAQATVFKEVRYLISNSELGEILEVTQREIKFKDKELNEKYVSKGVLFTYNDGANKDKLSAGLHGDYNIFILDEANNLDKGLFSQLKGTLGTGRLCVIASANPEDDLDPNVPFSYFAKVMEDESNSISGMQWHRFYLNINDANFPEKNKKAMMEAYVEGTPDYEKYVLGKNVKQKTNILLFPFTDVQKCIYIDKVLPVDRFENNIGCFGVDVAMGKGRHYSVIAYRHLLDIYIEFHSNHVPLPTLRQEIMKFSMMSGHAPFYIDENGPGASIIQMLSQNTQVKLIPANASSRVHDNVLLFNRQIQLYRFLSSLIKTGLLRIHIPHSCIHARESLLNECTHIITDFKSISKENANGAEYVVTKSKNSSVSPDIIDAMSNTLAGFTQSSFQKFLEASIRLSRCV